MPVLSKTLVALFVLAFLFLPTPLVSAAAPACPDPNNPPGQYVNDFNGTNFCPDNTCFVPKKSGTGLQQTTRYYCYKTAVTFGPIKIITPDEYEGDSKITLQVTTQNPATSVRMLDIPKTSSTEYSLGTIDIPTNSDYTPVTISIGYPSLIINGSTYTGVSFEPDSALFPTISPGGTTGEVIFTGSRIEGAGLPPPPPSRNCSAKGLTISADKKEYTIHEVANITLTADPRGSFATSKEYTTGKPFDLAVGQGLGFEADSEDFVVNPYDKEGRGVTKSIKLDGLSIGSYTIFLRGSSPLGIGSDIICQIPAAFKITEDFSSNARSCDEVNKDEYDDKNPFFASSENCDKRDACIASTSTLAGAGGGHTAITCWPKKVSEDKQLKLTINPKNLKKSADGSYTINFQLDNAKPTTEYTIWPRDIGGICARQDQFVIRLGTCAAIYHFETGEAQTSYKGSFSFKPFGDTPVIGGGVFDEIGLVNWLEGGSKNVCVAESGKEGASYECDKERSDIRTWTTVTIEGVDEGQVCRAGTREEIAKDKTKSPLCNDLVEQGYKDSTNTITECTTADKKAGFLCPGAGEVFCLSVDVEKERESANPDDALRCMTPPSSSTGALTCTPKGGTKDSGIITALGCVPTEPGPLIEGVLRFATFAGGGIALLIMVFASISMITSLGNAEKIKQAQEQFTSAIIGLLFIIFAVLLLKVIGVDILGIPGFG